MAAKEFWTRIQSKRDTAANWTANNPVLLDGEIIIVDTSSGEVRFKIGDGEKKYSQLPFQDEYIRSLISQSQGGAGDGSYVRYDAPQELTDAQISQALDNIQAERAGSARAVKDEVQEYIDAITAKIKVLENSSGLAHIFPEQTVNGFVLDDAWQAYTPGYVYPASFILVKGDSYHVEWNGEEFDCVAGSFEQTNAGTPYEVIYIGNGSQIGMPGNQEPFMITYVSKYDNIQFFSSENRAENTIHIYQSIDLQRLYRDVENLKDATRDEIFPEQEIGGFSADNGYMSAFSDAYGSGPVFPAPFELSSGTPYHVEWNGVHYKCTAKLLSATGVAYIGNGTLIGEEQGNDEPFVIGYGSINGQWSVFYASNENQPSNTVYIYKSKLDSIEELAPVLNLLSYTLETKQPMITGEPGQFVVIGDDGNVTTKSFAEFGSGEIVDIFPEQMLDFQSTDNAPNGQSRYSKMLDPAPFALEVGQEYIVEWNGKQYIVYAKQSISNPDIILLGDGYLISYDEEQGVGRFVITYNPTDDIVEVITDSYSGLGGLYKHQLYIYQMPVKDTVSWNDLTDRPFGEEITEETLLQPTSIGAFRSNAQYGGMYSCGKNWNDFESTILFTEGETYLVHWDGETYRCTAQSLSTQPGAVLLGNLSSVGGSGRNEPFAIGASIEGVTFFAADGSTQTTHTVGIIHERSTIHKIDPKYLPDNWVGGSGGGTSKKVIFEVQEVSGFVDAGSGGLTLYPESPLVIGETYTVKWDNKEYDCVAFGMSDIGPFPNGVVGLCNKAAMKPYYSGEITSLDDVIPLIVEPCVFLYIPTGTDMGDGIPTETDVLTCLCLADGLTCTSDTHTVGIYQKASSKFATEEYVDQKIGELMGSGGSTVDILPEQTFGFDEWTPGVMYTFVRPAPFELVPNETYHVDWNGEHYEFISKGASFEDDELVYIGNGVLAHSFGYANLTGNNEHFAIAYAYMNVLGGYVIVLISNEDRAENTVHIYQTTGNAPNFGSGLPPVTTDDNGKSLQVIDGEWQIVPTGSVFDETLLEKGTYPFAYNSYFGLYGYTQYDTLFTLEAGKEYAILWDGQVYIRSAIAFTATDGSSCVGVGNPLLAGLASNDDKFAIGIDLTHGYTLFFSLETTDSHEVAVYQGRSSGLPSVSVNDNSKILQVVNGEWKTVSSGGIFDVTLLDAKAYSFSLDAAVYQTYRLTFFEIHFVFNIGEEYSISWNDRTYVRSAFTFTDDSGYTWVAVGNPRVSGAMSNDDPFTIMVSVENGWTSFLAWDVSADESPVVRTVAIYQNSKFATRKYVQQYTDNAIANINRIIEDLQYEPITITSLTNNASGTSSKDTIVELGSTVNSVTLTWEFSKTPKILRVNGEALDARTPNHTYRELGLKPTEPTVVKYTVMVTDERDAVATDVTSISFVNGVYYGTITHGATIDSAAILRLTRKLQSTKGVTFTANAGADQHIIYALPASYGTPSMNVGGFDGGFNLHSTFMFTNTSGHAESYNVWLSDNTGLGTTTVKVS